MLLPALSLPLPLHPYPELPQVLASFVSQVSSQLGPNLVGIYLVGSLASGDFDLDSDIDFLVVTNTDVTEADMLPLQAIEKEIFSQGSYPAQHLEGSYISLPDLSDWSIVGQKELFYFDNGSTTYERNTHDNKWHVRWVLRECGITLLGPPPATLLPPIPLAEMLEETKATMRQINGLFEAEIDRPLSFLNSRFGQSFIVLTICRMLHTLHTGTVQSKKAGAEWAKGYGDPKREKLIDQAWAEREGVRFGAKIHQPADPSLLHQTLEFIQYALAKIDRE